ncbi:hypothetical protein AJ79_10068 [Helicocarpus griseus UAMH5409]|uniref:Protein PNS1 n=1 Tax=Helicocarpus griseus UAMH5409 TaxID=1447875 RepID=A0A2B7WFX1_9EURO|nr:hypothetical protein AJ79_10068 [Helicocarpus griseus UAMH5409]
MSQPPSREEHPGTNQFDAQGRAADGCRGSSWPAINVNMGNMTFSIPKLNLRWPFSRKKDDGPRAKPFQEVFKLYKREYHDIWAGILFLLTLAGFIFLSSAVLSRYVQGADFKGHIVNDSSNTIALDTNVLIIFGSNLTLAISFSTVYFQIYLWFPDKLIWITGILNTSVGLGTGLWSLYKKEWGVGITFLMFGLFALCYFVSWIPRIPFTTVLLRTTSAVTRSYTPVHLVSLFGAIFAVGFTALVFVTLVATYIAFTPEEKRSNPICGDAECKPIVARALTTFITFVAYWVTEWMKNTMHTTTAGVHGSWYFYSNNSNSNSLPRSPIRGALKRALTYSFGSICFGSLFVAVVDGLRQLCTISRREEMIGGRNSIGMIANRAVGGFMSGLRYITQTFNRYAFCHVALYGKPYLQASKYIWQLMEYRGIDTLVNDSIVGASISMGAVFVGYICGFLAYAQLNFMQPDFNVDGKFTPAFMAYAFLSGFQICKVCMTPVSSGVDTTFMAMGMEPEVLVTHHPELWESLLVVYPRVQNTIHPTIHP